MRRFLIPLALFLAAGYYFYHQACPSFYYWDSAELTAAVLGNGVPHPPGFPFFLILAGVWQRLLPLGAAFGLNIFSAFFGALGISLWYLVVVRILRAMNLSKGDGIISLVSLLAVAVMGVSLTYSIQAVRFEVYSLNFTGFALLLLICLTIAERETPSRLLRLLFFTLLGLFLAVHNLTIALAIPGLLLLLIWRKKITLGGAALGTIGAFILSGLFYLILLFRAQGNPSLNWGDPANLGNLVDYIMIKGFAVSASGFALSHQIEQISFAYNLLYSQLGPAALALSLFGLGYIIWRNRVIGFSLVLILVLNILSVIFAENYFYENYDLHGYLMISLAIAVVYLAITFLLVHNLIVSRFRGKRAGVTRALALGIFVIFAMLVLAPPARENFGSADLSKVRGAEEFAGQFLSDAPDSAVVVTSSYNTYFCALAYQAAFPVRGGKTVVNLYSWDQEWGREQCDRLLGLSPQEEFTRQNYYSHLINRIGKTRPIYIEYDQASAPIAASLAPHGMGYVLDDMAADHLKAGDSCLSQAAKAEDLESIRTWALWLQNRGEYYKQLEKDEVASRYFALIDTIAARANLR